MTGNQLVRKFVLFTDADVERFMAFMRANRKPMAEQQRFLQLVVSEYKASRSNEQNAYMWAAILTPMEEQAFVGGARYKADIWHELAKELFLPDVCAKGVSKWQYLPNGSRRLMMGTGDLIDVAVIDEAQMIFDPWRGWAWTQAIVGAPAKELLIICSAYAVPAIENLLGLCGERCTVRHFERKQHVELLPQPVPVSV